MNSDQPITGAALEVFRLRLNLAQLNHDSDALVIVMDDIVCSGLGFLWGVAALLSATWAEFFTQHCGGDRQAAARRAEEELLEMHLQTTEDAPIIAAAWQLVLVQLCDPDAMVDVLDDIESQGLLESATNCLNGMVVQTVVQDCGGDREAARREIALMLAAALDKGRS